MKVYISGNYENPANKPFFRRREVELTEMGYTVINPMREFERISALKHRIPTTAELYKNNIKKLLDSDYISMLEGWEESELSRFEKEFSLKIEMKEIDVKKF